MPTRAEIEAQLDELHRTVLCHSRFRPMEWTIRTITPGVSLVHLNWQMKGTGPTRRGILTLVLTLVRDRSITAEEYRQLITGRIDDFKAAVAYDYFGNRAIPA